MDWVKVVSNTLSFDEEVLSVVDTQRYCSAVSPLCSLRLQVLKKQKLAWE
jgi:hypothetical protein